MRSHDEKFTVMMATIGATLELWASSLQDVKGRMRSLF